MASGNWGGKQIRLDTHHRRGRAAPRLRPRASGPPPTGCGSGGSGWRSRSGAVDPIPPIEVYRVGGCHFVIDGHQRISIAAAVGERLIEANVTQLLTAVPSGPGRSPVHADSSARAVVCCA